jgi:signal transduction histidine kinase
LKNLVTFLAVCRQWWLRVVANISTNALSIAHLFLAMRFTSAETNPLPFVLDILVVADSTESLDALKALVMAAGHQVRSVQSGSEAYAYVRDYDPDLMLLDLQRPGLDSFEFTRRLRLRHDDRLLQVIMISPSHGDDQVIHALHCGADDYLPRPINAALLEAKLRQISGMLKLRSRLVRLAQRQLDIIDNITDSVITLDMNGHVEDMNSRAHEQFDPRPHFDHALPWRGGDCLSLLGVSLKELLTQRECCVRRVDGSLLVVEVSYKEWREQGGVRYTLVLRDLTEQRAVELMHNEFLATVSHELRTPLTSVLGSLGLLAGGAAGSLPPAAQQLATVAQRNGKRLSRLVDDILDLTKLRSDQFVLQLRPQPIGPLLQEALEASQAYASTLSVQLEGEGIDAHGSTEIQLDADRFLQVMANLLSNAIKHSPAGEVVKLTLLMTPSALRVSVRDRGPGIDPAFRAQLFKLFSKAAGDRHAGQSNSGIGLYISRLLVERMGGDIAAEPATARPNVGATFSVVFPLQPTL